MFPSSGRRFRRPFTIDRFQVSIVILEAELALNVGRPGSADSPENPGISAPSSPLFNGLICLIEWILPISPARSATGLFFSVKALLQRQGDARPPSKPTGFAAFRPQQAAGAISRPSTAQCLLLTRFRAARPSILHIKHACKGPISHAFLICTNHLETRPSKAR